MLSDGAVANHGNYEIGIRYYKKLAKQIEKEGIVEVIGIGFGANDIKQYFKNVILVSGSGTGLAKSLFEQLKKIFRI